MLRFCMPIKAVNLICIIPVLLFMVIEDKSISNIHLSIIIPLRIYLLNEVFTRKSNFLIPPVRAKMNIFGVDVDGTLKETILAQSSPIRLIRVVKDFRS